MDLKTKGDPIQTWDMIASEPSLYGRAALSRLYTIFLLEQGFTMESIQEQITDTEWRNGFSCMPTEHDRLGIRTGANTDNLIQNALGEARLCYFDLLHLSETQENLPLNEQKAELLNIFGHAHTDRWEEEWNNEKDKCRAELAKRNEVPSVEYLRYASQMFRDWKTGLYQDVISGIAASTSGDADAAPTNPSSDEEQAASHNAAMDIVRKNWQP